MDGDNLIIHQIAMSQTECQAMPKLHQMLFYSPIAKSTSQMLSDMKI
jgi:hypothetical protein